VLTSKHVAARKYKYSSLRLVLIKQLLIRDTAVCPTFKWKVRLLCVMKVWENDELISLLLSSYEKGGFVQQVTGKHKR
jgi:hypothetical protein